MCIYSIALLARLHGAVEAGPVMGLKCACYCTRRMPLGLLPQRQGVTVNAALQITVSLLTQNNSRTILIF